MRRTMTSIWCSDPVPDHLVQAERARHAVDQGHHVRAEGVLQLSVLVQVVQHHLGHGVALEHDHEPLAGPAAALVPHIGNAGDPAVLGQLGDLLREVVRVHLERQLGDDQADPALAVFLHLDHGPHGDRAAARCVCVADAAAADDLAVGGEVRALDPLEQGGQQFLVAGLEVLQEPLRAGGHFPQVVRRDLGGHPDGDALRAVDQQVREPGGQHHGLGDRPS